MNKIKLTIALVFGFTIANAQDTTCTFFNHELVLKFNYQTSKIIGSDKHEEKYYDIIVNNEDVLCLHLTDKKKRVRNIITTFTDGFTYKEVLDSKNHVYYSPRGAIKISVGKPKLMIKL